MNVITYEAMITVKGFANVLKDSHRSAIDDALLENFIIDYDIEIPNGYTIKIKFDLMSGEDANTLMQTIKNHVSTETGIDFNDRHIAKMIHVEAIENVKNRALLGYSLDDFRKKQG